MQQWLMQGKQITVYNLDLPLCYNIGNKFY